MLSNAKPFYIFKKDISGLFVFADTNDVSKESSSCVEFSLPFPNS